ncbi:hypothetical protein M8J75_006528 [Diaphorina citri]|nr:hypothetical protein M8J75_006528 [Diaphorina citri]
MYVQCSTFLGVIQFILIIGLDCNDYYPEYEPTVTYSPNTTWLTSSEQERIDFKALDDHILNFTLPGTVADVLEKHGVIETKGWEERLNVAKTFYRNRKKKYYNNLTGLHQSYYQRMARIHAKMMDDIEFKDHNYRKDPGMHGEKIEKLVQELPEIQAMKLHQHEVTVDIPEYSGDIIKDDYEVRRKRRAVDETEIHEKLGENHDIVKRHVDNKHGDVPSKKRELYKDYKSEWPYTGTVYNTIMTVYFKCMYNYMRDMYSSSYLSPSHQHVQPDTDQDYMDAIERIKQWYQKISNTSANSNLSFTILNEGYQQYTQYIALNWYTETYSDNRTQYFCDYGNDTYMLVNNKLQLFNKTLHQLVSFPDQNVTQPMTNDSIFLDVRTIEPPKLSWINSEELKKRNINVPDDEQYIIVKNLSDPFSMHRGSLNDIYGQKIPMSLYPSSNQTQKENIESSTNPANGNTFSLTLNQTVTDYPEDLLDKAADFVLSFYFKNTTMHEETTTDDYTEVTDCFDKFENAAIRFFKGSNNSTNSTPGNSRDITENLNWSNVSSTNKISLWASSNDMKNSTTNKIVSTSMNPATMTGVKNNLPKKHNLPIDQRKIRAKRSLLSRCIKGLKLVGGVFRPVEKGVVNVLDDVFGPYSSSDIRSGQMNAVKDSFSKTNKLAYSRENILKNHETSVSLSSKERRAESKDESRFKSDSDKKELQTSKDNSLTTKINSAPYSVENSDNKATTKRSKKKKKHRKKHKKVDIFDTNERDQTKSDKHTNEIVKEKSTEDQTLPSFIKNPKFGDQDTSNTMFDSNNGAHHLDEQIGSTKFPDYNDAQNPYGRNQPFGNNTFQDYNDAQNPYGRNQPFGNQMGNNTFQDYNDPQNPYGRNQPFGNQMGNNTFQDYNDPQNPYGRDQPFGNKMGNNTFPDYNDPQNPYGRDQPFGNKMGNNTFPDYNDPQNPYGRNQPLGNQMGNNTFQDYNDAQNPYAKNQPFGNQMENNTFQDYDAQNPYGRNQPFGNQMGNNTFQDYDAKNQPFGNQMGNNTFQDYNDPQNPYAKNQPFGNQMGNNTFQDYDAQNPYGRNQPFGNQMGNNTFQDYDAQNPYGKNQPFGNQMGNNTFQDYDVQNPYAKNQPFGNQMGNNTFQDYNDPQNQMPLDFNGQQNPYLKNGYPGTNGTFPDYNNQPAPMDANQFAKNQNNMQNIPTNQSNANVLNPLNNYDEMNNHQFNGNGDINNQNAPGPSQNFVPPQSNVGKYQALNNNLGNFPVQNNVVDPNKVEQSQLQSATQKNIPSNDTPPTPGNQNPSGIHQQVNVTNFYISTLSKLFLNNETISQIEVDVEAKGVNDTLKSSVPCEMVKNNGSTTTIAKSITMARVSNITMSTFINVTCINSHSLMNLETKFSEDKQNVTKLPLLQNCSKLENNDYQPYENKSISFSVEDWLANSNVTFDTNIFENVSSKPVTEKEHATLIEIGNETKTSVQNHFSNSSDVIEETKKLTQATTIPTTTSDHITDEWTTKVTVCVIRKNISNESQLIMDKHKLEELLDSIYTSNTSSMNVKTVLDKLLKNTAASDWKPILSTTDIEGLRTPLDTQQLPEYFSVNISGSPYVLMKQESSKLNPGLSNVQNDENIINPSNSFGRGSNSLNAFQNVNAQPNYLGANYFNPQQNFMNPEPNPLYPYNFLSQQSPLIVPNNIPGQDYQMPLVNPFLEPGNNLSYGPYQQVYPNYPPPLIPPLASPYPPMPLALPQPFFVILNNEVLNNLPEDLKLKLLNNKNLTRQLMHMQNNNNNNQYMYDEKDYTAPAGRDY